MSDYGPKQAFSDQLHAEKYRGQGEDFRDCVTRLASTLSDGDDHFREFRDIIGDQRFLPGGRIQAAVGANREVTPYNCYVSGTIADTLRDQDGIMRRLDEAAGTLRLGGGIGYDFSTLRPNGARIKKLDSNSTGPVSFMGIFDAMCRTIASAGHRRGAQMGVLRIDHPDIEEFINAKHNDTALTAFNMSIAVTDEFMQCLESGCMFPLRFENEIYRSVDPSNLWEMVMRSTWDWAEPGVIFIDRVNRMNNLRYCETIAATNPCGEQPLPPFGACLLGSFNLTKYIVPTEHPNPQNFEFDFDQFEKDIPAVVRAMDNVIDRATYPLPQQKFEATNKRRMGLGITGLANSLEAMGYPYGSEDFLMVQTTIMLMMQYEVYGASVELAKEKGHFAAFKPEYVNEHTFIRGMPSDMKERMLIHGIRNSHLLSIAPTGTISLTADNISSGIEPVFAYEVDRTINLKDGLRKVRVKDYGVEYFGVEGKRAHEVTVQEHLDVLLTASRYVDSAVSKTINVPESTPWRDFKKIYVDAWKGGAKGCTTYTVGGKREGIMVSTDEDEVDEGAACRIDSETGRKECE